MSSKGSPFVSFSASTGSSSKASSLNASPHLSILARAKTDDLSKSARQFGQVVQIGAPIWTVLHSGSAKMDTATSGATSPAPRCGSRRGSCWTGCSCSGTGPRRPSGGTGPSGSRWWRPRRGDVCLRQGCAIRCHSFRLRIRLRIRPFEYY
jgi:hypothetical protein